MIKDKWIIIENDGTKEIILNPDILLDEAVDSNDYVKIGCKYIPKDCTVISEITHELEIDMPKLVEEIIQWFDKSQETEGRDI